MHLMSPACEPLDVEINGRHLRVIHSQLTDTDKVPFLYARGVGQVTDGFAMARIANQLTEEQFRERHYIYTVINTNSPRQLDVPMCLGMIQFAEANQVNVITPVYARRSHGPGDPGRGIDAPACRGNGRHPLPQLPPCGGDVAGEGGGAC